MAGRAGRGSAFRAGPLPRNTLCRMWEHPGWYLSDDLAAARGVAVESITKAVARGYRTVPAPDRRDGGVMRWRADRPDVRAFMDEKAPARAAVLLAQLVKAHGSRVAAAKATGVHVETLARIAQGKAQIVRGDTLAALEAAVEKLPEG